MYIEGGKDIKGKKKIMNIKKAPELLRADFWFVVPEVDYLRPP